MNWQSFWIGLILGVSIGLVIEFIGWLSYASYLGL